jgi:hypothetical protein
VSILIDPRTRELYPALLGARWRDLHHTLARLHGGSQRTIATGRFRIEHGKRAGIGWLARVLRLPKESADVATKLVIERTDALEMWHRSFDEAELSTTQRAVSDGSLAERFGPMELVFRIAVLDGSLLYEQVAARIRVGIVNVPLPRVLSPRVSAREMVDPETGRIHVAVSVDAPLLGRLIDYSGRVEMVDEP